MEKLEEQIQIEYYRLLARTGIYPTFLHVHPRFIHELIAKYSIYGEMKRDAEGNTTFEYMGMKVIRSLDLKEEEFLLSFNKYDL